MVEEHLNSVTAVDQCVTYSSGDNRCVVALEAAEIRTPHCGMYLKTVYPTTCEAEERRDFCCVCICCAIILSAVSIF